MASESKVIIHPEFDGDIQELTEYETTIVNALLHQEELAVFDVLSLINTTTVFAILNTLIRKEIVQIREELHDKYKEKILRIVELYSDN